MEVFEWSSTKEALLRLRESLNCGLCMQLLREPCSLGSCDHLFCRACIGDHVGNSCPVCHVQAWAKELKVKRELANVVKLYNKMCRLIDPSSNNKVPSKDAVEHRDDSVESMCDLGEPPSNQEDSHPHNVAIGEPEAEDSQRVATKHHHNVKKVVKTVVGKHGKLSCIVKLVSNDDGSEKPASKKTISVSTRKHVKGKETQSSQQHVESSSDITTDSLSDAGSMEEADSMAVYDFIASPARPKPAKPIKKKTVKKVDLKVLRARRVAAANKKWNKSSKFTKSSTKQKRGGRHVSFQEDTDSDTKKATEHSARVESMDTGSDSMWDDVDTEDDQPSELQSTKQITALNKQLYTTSKSKTNSQKSPLSSAPDTNDNIARPGADNNLNTAKKNKKNTAKSSSRLSAAPAGKENVGGVREHKGISPGKNSAKRNIRGETPLHIAAIKGDAASVEELLKEGADPNVKDNAGWMPLHEACNHGHTACVALLLEHGALINAPGFENDSPLHDAVTNNRVDVVKLLVERGASLKARNMHGLTPSDYAQSDELKAALNTKPLVTISPMTSLKIQPNKNQPPVFLATGLGKAQKNKLDSCAKLLKGRIVNDFCPEVTHLVAACNAEGICMRTSKYLQAILMGKWVVNYTWVLDCLKRKERVDEQQHEVPGTTADPTSSGPSRGRQNALNQFPGLFDGCNFFFFGTFKPPTPTKNELSDLVKSGGGSLVQRQPKPDDDVIQTSTTVPYHARHDSRLANCSYYIIYDNITTRVPPKVNTGKVCTAPVSWLMNCISNFALIDLPN